jgi:dihydrofolate reductase
MKNWYMISAMASSTRAIGLNGELPWGHLSEDMRHFQELTKNNIVVMGHNTFKSLGTKPLANRKNVVLTSRVHYNNKDVECFHTLDDLVYYIDKFKASKDVYIIGGAQIYEYFLWKVSRLYLTLVKRKDGAKIVGDTFFPNFDPVLDFRLVNSVDYENEEYEYSVCTFANIKDF